MDPVKQTSEGGMAAGAQDHMQPVRVFVALKIAPDLAQELAGMSEALKGAAVRRIAAADIHLTLVPPWREQLISEAIAKLANVAVARAPFHLEFRHVSYGPEPRHPRLLWVECAASRELADLRAALMAAFGQAEQRPFWPHVTLARIRQHGAAIARRHPIDRELALSQRIGSVELMQSPNAGGIGYSVLASLPLGRPAGGRRLI